MDAIQTKSSVQAPRVCSTGQTRARLLRQAPSLASRGAAVSKEGRLRQAMGEGVEALPSKPSAVRQMFAHEMFEDLAWVMAKHADPSVPDSPDEWLEQFNTFSIYQVLPELIELWGLNVQTQVESKKTSKN